MQRSVGICTDKRGPPANAALLSVAGRTVAPMTTNSRPDVSLLVMDLDNTAWDWFAAWHASFAPMLDRLAADSGVPQDQLEREIREVHQRRGTAEYSYLLGELPSLLRLHGEDADIATIYNDVLHVLNKERKQNTRLYDGVRETLMAIRDRGVPVVAYTESIAFWTEWRVRHVGLDGLLNVLYSSLDHDWPEDVDPLDLRTKPADQYGLKLTEHRHVPRGVTKPNTLVLGTILSDYGMDADRTAYIGDSLTKDIVMAQAAGVHDVHAAYGVSDHRDGYDLLRRVSHWPDSVIKRERDAAAGQVPIKPAYTAQCFQDLLDLFDFVPNAGPA
jgi:phosphoglycolate phosphatase-like HAD superfamily hydrolase